jgi:hypothetical protein
VVVVLVSFRAAARRWRRDCGVGEAAMTKFYLNFEKGEDIDGELDGVMLMKEKERCTGFRKWVRRFSFILE